MVRQLSDAIPQSLPQEFAVEISLRRVCSFPARDGRGQTFSFNDPAPQNRDSYVIRRTENICFDILRLSAAFMMGQLQKSILIGVTDILFVAQYPPEHSDQPLAVLVHGGEYPPLALGDSFGNGEIPN